MRNRSIAGPLVLVLIGVLFLVNNLRPELSAVRLILSYWPFLLIAFGVVRLLEVLVDAGRGKPLPQRGISGGQIVLLVLVCLLLYSIGRPGHYVHFANLENGGIDLFGEQFDYPVSAHSDTAGATKLVLDNLRGNLTITGTDGTSVLVEGRKLIRAYNKSDADQADRVSQIHLVREGDQLVIKGELGTGVTMPQMPDLPDMPNMGNRHPRIIRLGNFGIDHRFSTDLEIKVPRGMSVESRGRQGDLTINAINGSVDISNARGDVRLNEIGGDAKVESNRSNLVRAVDMKGSLDLHGRGTDIVLENIAGQVTIEGNYSGTLEFKKLAKALRFHADQAELTLENLPGSITMDLGDFRATNVGGPMRFVTKSRDVHVEDFTNSLEVELDHGDVEVKASRTPLGKIDVHSQNGNIDLALPERAEFDLKASSSQGEATNDYGPAVTMETEGRSASLKSAQPKGTSVVATTDRGSITVRKN